MRTDEQAAFDRLAAKALRLRHALHRVPGGYQLSTQVTHLGRVVDSLADVEKLLHLVQAQRECRTAGHSAKLDVAINGRPTLTVSRWGLTRTFHELSDAQRWLANVTGRKA